MESLDKQKIVIFGTGQFAKTTSTYFTRYSNYEVVAYIDSKKEKKYFDGSDILVLSPSEFLKKYPPENYKMFIAVGYTEMNEVRNKLYSEYKGYGYSFVNFIHPNVEWWENTTIGENSFIFENNVVQQNVSIGNNVTLWSGNHIGHDSQILDNVWITSHVVVYSHVTIGKNCFIGSNVNIRDGIGIGEYSFVGAGSNVWKSADNYSVFLVKPTKPSSLRSDNLHNLLV